ncbi:MAG: ABC transporter permease [Coriobacteriia bacterium]|nr:ABC transporter permease [Coriobacteriia bacterium]
MSTIRTARAALAALRANGLRSILMALGVVIGAATIVLVVAIGLGARASIDEQYSNMSVTTIFVNQVQNTVSDLSAEDAEVIAAVPTVAAVAPQLTGRAGITAGEVTAQTMVVGTTLEYEKIAALDFSAGGFFTTAQIDDRERVVVLGPTAAEELFGAADPIGQTVRIAGRSLEVIGVTTPKGGSIGPITLDDSVFVPYTTAERTLLGSTGKVSLNAQATSIEKVPATIDAIALALRDAHHLSSSQGDDFTIKDMGSKLVSAQESSRTMTMLLGGVASIVLLVGGIGIMNIMYVAVTERTREIGVRRAVGATRADVLLQFLLEAVILSVGGGAIGVAIGLAMIPLAESLGLRATFSLSGVVLAFAFAVLTGVVFGYAPARKAAALDPIEALRYE